MGFNPRDFMSVQDAVKQSQTAQAAPQPQAGGYIPQYVGKEAYSTTVMPETGAPGPNRSMAGSRTHATLGTANDMAKLYGGRVLQANMAQGPTRTNAAQYAVDFGVPGSDPLNAGLLAERFDTSNPNRDKFWDSAFWRDKSVQDELLYAQRYNPTAAKRDQSSFEGPVNNPQYQWSTPQGGANYLNGGQAPIGKARLSISQGAGIGLPGARPQAAPQTAQMNTPRTSAPQSLYGANRPAAQSSPHGALNRTAAPSPSNPRASAPVISAYRAPGSGNMWSGVPRMADGGIVDPYKRPAPPSTEDNIRNFQQRLASETARNAVLADFLQNSADQDTPRLLMEKQKSDEMVAVYKSLVDRHVRFQNPAPGMRPGQTPPGAEKSGFPMAGRAPIPQELMVR